jgi:predicted HicB family RNase H-like nuclease
MKALNLRLPDEVHQMIQELAEQDNRSINSEIISIIQRHYQIHKKDK